MKNNDAVRIYEELGATPVINAMGPKTTLGGSRLSPGVRAAMDAANHHFVDMEELLEESGKVIANMAGVEAALVTPGCAAAIALGAAVCMAGDDPEKSEQLPDTTGMKDEFIVQKRRRYKYDRCVTIFGGKLVEVGDEENTTREQLRAAITDKTAAIHHLAPAEKEFGSTIGRETLPLAEIIEIAKEFDVRVIVDAATKVYPLNELHKYTDMGADFACYGGKYFGSCNSTGLMFGRKELIDAALLHSFIGFETSQYRTIGRPLKLDRQEIVGCVVALREWLSMDHEARASEQRRKGQVIQCALKDNPHVTMEWDEGFATLNSGLRVTIDEKALGTTAAKVTQSLAEGRPSIIVQGSGNPFYLAVSHLGDGEEEIVAERMKALLTG